MAIAIFCSITGMFLEEIDKAICKFTFPSSDHRPNDEGRFYSWLKKYLNSSEGGIYRNDVTIHANRIKVSLCFFLDFTSFFLFLPFSLFEDLILTFPNTFLLSQNYLLFFSNLL